MSKKVKIKPCPFCGGKATIKTTYIEKTHFLCVYVGCYNKDCVVSPCAHIQNSEVPELGWDKSKSVMIKTLQPKAIEAWNTRI